RRHPAVAHADLKAGGQDVGEHETGLIADTFGKLVQRGVRKRYPDVLRLGAVDQVTQDPSDTTVSLLIETVGGQPLVPVGTDPASIDAGDDDTVTDVEVGHGLTDLDDGAHALVAEDSTFIDGGDIPGEDVQVSAA